jgi:hypothetical protein
MRALKILVIVMGLLIVAGLTVIFATLAKRMAGAGEPHGGFDSAALQLPKGCRVVEMAAAGPRLALRLGDGPGCEAILFVDPATGQQLGRLQLLQQP